MNRDSRRSRLVLALLLLTAFTLVTLDYRAGNGSPLQAVRNIAASAFGPVERGMTTLTRPIGEALGALVRPGRTRSQLEALRRENDALRLEQHRIALDAARASQLAALLRLKDAGRYTLVPAQVVALGPGLTFEWTATIDAGSSDGVRVDMTVVNGAGLVGRVTRVTAQSAVVLLAIDPLFHTGARLEGSLQIGYTGGQGLAPMTLTLPNPHAKVRPGDRLVTQPAGRPFAPGVPIGRVSHVVRSPGALTRTALVTPFVNFTALDLVAVIVVPPRTDPRDRVLPVQPAPRPTPVVRPTQTPRPAPTGRAAPTGRPTPTGKR